MHSSVPVFIQTEQYGSANTEARGAFLSICGGLCWSPMAGHLWEPTASCTNDYHKGTGSEFKNRLFSLPFLRNLRKIGTTYIPHKES